MPRFKLIIFMLLSILQISLAHSVPPVLVNPFRTEADLEAEAQKITKGIFTVLVRDTALLYDSNVVMLLSNQAKDLILAAINKQQANEDPAEKVEIAAELLNQLLFLISYEGRMTTLVDLIEDEALLYLTKVTDVKMDLDEYFYDGISGLDYFIKTKGMWPFKSIFETVMSSPVMFRESNLGTLLTFEAIGHIEQSVASYQAAGVNSSNIHEVTAHLLDKVLMIIGTVEEPVKFSRGQRWMAQRNLSQIFGSYESSFAMSHFGDVQVKSCKRLMSSQVTYVN